jgi:hypothetical protein
VRVTDPVVLSKIRFYRTDEAYLRKLVLELELTGPAASGQRPA